jgi:DMSO/TMAO reductase YedYZ heme-binding membrane subunit
MPKVKSNPFYYSENKNIIQKFVDIAVPVGLFLLFFFFYNHSQISPSEMVKTSGLLAITLLGVTLIIGPLSKIFPALDFLKVHRKFWGILSVIIVFIHIALVTIFFYKFNLYKFIDISNPKYPGIFSGILAVIILLLVTFTSNQKAVNSLSPGAWKAIQTTSYIALFLAIAHFYLMEQVNGTLVIKRLLGRIIFGFSIFVIIARILIIFLSSKKT